MCWHSRATGLSRVGMPGSDTEIGESAFAVCFNLSEIIILTATLDKFQRIKNLLPDHLISICHKKSPDIGECLIDGALSLWNIFCESMLTSPKILK